MPEVKGLYPKYLVFRHPEEDFPVLRASHMHVHGDPPLPHEHSLELVDDFCFVLKPGSDRHARVGVAAYAQSVMEDDPMLGEELMQIITDGPRK